MRLAYFAARFPTLSETFILNEMVALSRLGGDITMFAIHRERQPQQHPAAADFLQTAHFGENPLKLLFAQIHYLWRRPKQLLGLWRTLLRQFGRRPGLLWRNAIALLAGCHFARCIDGRDFHHLHAHWANHTTFAAYCAARLTDLPFSFTAHANDIFVDQTMLAEKMASAVAIATISDYNQRWLAQHAHPKDQDKIHVIRCGVDVKALQPKERSRCSDDRPVFVCLARLHEKKGHRYLLEACAQLLADGNDFECWLIGDGERATPLARQITKLGLKENLFLLGGLPHPQVINRLQAADYMVLPSITTAAGRREGIPVSLMEGMALGLAVIATRLSGTPELVRDGLTGLLVPERDPAALAAAMRHFIQYPAAAQSLAQAGRQLVVAEYNLQQNSRKLFHLIKAGDWSAQPVSGRVSLTADEGT